MESRVLTSARRFRDLGVDAPTEIPSLDPVDIAPRGFTKPELRGSDAPELPPPSEAAS